MFFIEYSYLTCSSEAPSGCRWEAISLLTVPGLDWIQEMETSPSDIPHEFLNTGDHLDHEVLFERDGDVLHIILILDLLHDNTESAQ